MILNMTKIKMFIKDICKDIAFYARNQISGMQHDWSRFRQCDKWKRNLLRSIALGIIVAFVFVGAIGGFAFLYFIARAFAWCQLFVVVGVIFAALAVYFTWLFICCVAKIEEEKKIKEFCEG